MLAEALLPSTAAGADLPMDASISVKEAVLPCGRFLCVYTVLGPEMRSTGEVMGVAHDFPSAFAKASAAAGSPLPAAGTVFVSVTDSDKAEALEVARMFHEQGFALLATSGTQQALADAGLPCERTGKLQDAANGGPGTAVSAIEAGDVALVINTPTGSGARTDGYEIRRAAITAGVPCLTTVAAGRAAALAIASAREGEPSVIALQELNA